MPQTNVGIRLQGKWKKVDTFYFRLRSIGYRHRQCADHAAVEVRCEMTFMDNITIKYVYIYDILLLREVFPKTF